MVDYLDSVSLQDLVNQQNKSQEKSVVVVRHGHAERTISKFGVLNDCASTPATPKLDQEFDRHFESAAFPDLHGLLGDHASRSTRADVMIPTCALSSAIQPHVAMPMVGMRKPRSRPHVIMWLHWLMLIRVKSFWTSGATRKQITLL